MTEAKPYKFDGVYKVDGRFATVNLVPGYKSTNEEIIKVGDIEYRIWDWWTSKPSAAFKKGLKIFPLKKSDNVLYLGLSEGKTASFFSDIIGSEGMVFGVEISERSLREAIPMCERRGNIIPILGDARIPEKYESTVFGKVNFIYEDVASPDQIQILIRNTRKFLKPSGFAAIAIKSQSIDVIKKPEKIYEESLKELDKHFEILHKVELDPYEKHHMFVIMKWKNV